MDLRQIIEEEKRVFERESAIYERLRQVGKKLNIIITEPIIRLRVVDQKTGELKLLRERHSHSFTRNQDVKAALFPYLASTGGSYADGQLAYKDIASTVVANSGVRVGPFTPANIETIYGFYGAAGVNTQGGVAGTDNTAESIDDFELGTIIIHDAAPPTAGRMEYLEMVLVEAWNGGSSYYYSIWTRPMDNNSGGAITVNEVGLIFRSFSGGGNSRFMIARDVIGGGQVVNNGDRLNVDYETRVSF